MADRDLSWDGSSVLETRSKKNGQNRKSQCRSSALMERKHPDYYSFTHSLPHINAHTHRHTHTPLPGGNIPGGSRDAVLAAVRVREM